MHRHYRFEYRGTVSKGALEGKRKMNTFDQRLMAFMVEKDSGICVVDLMVRPSYYQKACNVQLKRDFDAFDVHPEASYAEKQYIDKEGLHHEEVCRISPDELVLLP